MSRTSSACDAVVTGTGRNLRIWKVISRDSLFVATASDAFRSNWSHRRVANMSANAPKNDQTAFPNAYEVKGLSPHHRLVIALHSPSRVAETGLCVCPSEKNARKPARTVRRDTFSSTV
jgi:hypothetical protein